MSIYRFPGRDTLVTYRVKTVRQCAVTNSHSMQARMKLLTMVKFCYGMYYVLLFLQKGVWHESFPTDVGGNRL